MGGKVLDVRYRGDGTTEKKRGSLDERTRTYKGSLQGALRLPVLAQGDHGDLTAVLTVGAS